MGEEMSVPPDEPAGWGDPPASVEAPVQASVEAEVQASVDAEVQAVDAEVQATDVSSAAVEAEAPPAAAPMPPARAPADEAPATPTPYIPATALDAAALAEAVRSDQASMFLLQWLTHAESILAADRTGSAAFVEAALCLCGARRPHVKTHNGAPSALDSIATGRSARQLLSRCLVHIYQDEDAEKPPLYDTITSLSDAVSKEAVRPDTLSRHVAALDVSAALLSAFPNAAAMSHGALVPICLKLARTSSAPVLARYHALCLLEVLLTHHSVGTLSASGVKDLYKALRAALVDKAGPVVRAACGCLRALVAQHDALRAKGEIEGVALQCSKVMHTSDVATRTSLAELVAALLTQTELHGGSDGENAKGPVATPLYTPQEMLQTLQVYVARATTWQGRTGALQMYAALFAKLGASFIEGHYELLLMHLVNTLGQHTAAMLTPAEALHLRSGLRIVLQTYLCAQLTEPAQERAAVELGTHILGVWPPRTPNSPPPGDAALALSLDACTSLIASLGGLARPLHDALYEPVLTLLAHPSRPVQVRAAWWLRVACDVHPVLLAPTYTRLLQYVRRDVAALSTAQHDRGVSLRARLAGHSSALAALVPIAAAQPLYALNEDAEDVFALATDLLQQVAEHGLGEAAAAISAAWTLLGSLFALGPLFARPHIARLLQLWRNALAAPPNPTALDEGAWAFLFGVREGALSALLSFFLHGGASVLTQESARRVVGMLSNVLVFLNGFSVYRRTADADAIALLTREREPRVRALLLRCCTQLADRPALEPLQPTLMRLALLLAAQPERFVGSAAQAAISQSSGAFQMWSAADQYAYGVTSMVEKEGAALRAWSQPFCPKAYVPPHLAMDIAMDGVHVALDRLAHTPVVGALEHEPFALYVAPYPPLDEYRVKVPEAPAPPPAPTAEVDAALEFIAATLPFRERDAQIVAVEYLAQAIRAPVLEKNAGCRIAVLANSTVALLGALRTAMDAQNTARHPSGFANDRVTHAVRAVAQTTLLHGDAVLRASAAELYGRLAAVAGSQALASQVQFLIEQIVDNRHADSRAGCALAAGEVYARVGGLNASPLTKTVSRLLLSLARDPHPAVHCAALDALQSVIDAASLGYQPFVSSTLAVMSEVYAMPTHEPEGGSAGSSNLRVALPAYRGVACVVDAVVGVLGADLRESTTRRWQMYALLNALAHDHRAGIYAEAEAVHGLQRLGLIVPEMLETRQWAVLLYATLQREPLRLQRAAAAAYYQMAQRGTRWLAQYGGSPLLHALLMQLDRAASLDEIRALLLSWLRQSAPQRPCAWIDLCGTLLLAPETLATTPHTAAAVGDSEEEAAALATDVPTAPRAITGWRTRLFVLQCLHAVFVAVQSSATHVEHLGATADAANPASLASRVGELIKMAFSASTATNRAVRLHGLEVLRDVMESFATTRDPAFPEARLLEQFQAPLAAALTPAFSAESFPEVLASAIAVCAVYVGAGVTHAAPQSNRIVKLLVQSLNQTDAQPMTTLGEMTHLGPNAAAYLQIAVLHAWARLAIASREHASLSSVLEPHLVLLTQRWGTALAEYAVLREDGSAQRTTAFLPPMRAESALGELVQEQMLGHFAHAWPAMLQAITATLQRGAAPKDVSFLSLYALAFETLCRELERGDGADRGTLAIVLASLPVLAQDPYVGEFIVQPALFDELLRVAQRAFLTHDVPIALGVLHVLSALAQSLRERLLENSDGMVDDAHFADTPLGYMVRLLYGYVEQIPTMHGVRADKAALLAGAWSTLAELIHVCTAGVQAPLLASALHVFAAMAKREDDTAHVLAPALPVLRTLAHAACKVADAPLRTAVHGFLCALLDTANAMRTRSGDVAELKSRNALVAVSLVVASVDGRIPVSSEAIDDFTHLLAYKLQGDARDAQIALQCIAPMVQAPQRRHALRLAVGRLLPPLVAYVLAGAQAPDAQTGLALDQLVGVLATLDDKAAALCIVLPVLAAAVERPPAEAALREQACAHLVRLAQSYPTHLKTALASLPAHARTLLHDALRQAMGLAHGPPRAAPKSEARIALKTFGS